MRRAVTPRTGVVSFPEPAGSAREMPGQTPSASSTSTWLARPLVPSRRPRPAVGPSLLGRRSFQQPGALAPRDPAGVRKATAQQSQAVVRATSCELDGDDEDQDGDLGERRIRAHATAGTGADAVLPTAEARHRSCNRLRAVDFAVRTAVTRGDTLYRAT
jgi:hypothetical protein